jgi:hypothetical protein
VADQPEERRSVAGRERHGRVARNRYAGASDPICDCRVRCAAEDEDEDQRSGLPFGGTWTFEVTPIGDGGSVVRITEDGEVYNPVFRFVSRYFMGYTATIDSYLKALGAKFGETPMLEN